MTKNLLLAVVTMSLLCGCKKVFVEDSPNPAATQNPTSDELVSEAWSYPSTGQGLSLAFSYDQQHLVSSIVANQWSATPPNNPATTFQMEYSNGRLSRITDNLGDTYSLTYNSSGQLILLSAGPQNVDSSTFSYDDQGNLTGLKEELVTANETIFHVFSYDNLNDLVSEVDSQTLGTQVIGSQIIAPQLLVVKYFWSGYDNKVDFSLSVNGFPPALFAVLLHFGGGFNGEGNAIMSPHNAGAVADTVVTPVQNPASDAFPFAYQYNEQGLPVSIQYAGWTVTLQYQAY